jgi:hypothetical protein
MKPILAMTLSTPVAFPEKMLRRSRRLFACGHQR